MKKISLNIKQIVLFSLVLMVLDIGRFGWYDISFEHDIFLCHM